MNKTPPKIEFTKPEVTTGFGFIGYHWPDWALKVMVERYDDKGKAELSFYMGERHLHRASVNLLSTTTMNQLVKRMELNSTEVAWTDVIAYIVESTIMIAREGDPVEEIKVDESANLDPDYLVYPLLYYRHPIVIFGDGDSLKSWTALVIAHCVMNDHFIDGDLGLTIRKEPGCVLYLDYEDEKNSFEKRWSCLSKGFSSPYKNLWRKRMKTPLADNVENIKREVDRLKVNLIIVDSLAPAARGNLIDADPAIKYHAALREIGVTSLTIAHTSKNKDDKSKTIYGSVYFTNLARGVWECKATREDGCPEAIVSLKNTKANLSMRHSNLGLRYNFTSSHVMVDGIDLKSTSLSSTLPLPTQIKHWLGINGMMTVKDLAGVIDSSEAVIRTTCSRMKKQAVVDKIEESKGNEKWFLLAGDD